MIIAISDLHLGCGDELEDFLWTGEVNSALSKYKKSDIPSGIEKMHKIFDAFIEHLLSTKKSGEKITLLLCGDIFDCLQVKGDYGSPEKIDRIYQAHEAFFKSLNRFAEKGGEIIYLAGNHDHEMLNGECFNRLKKYLPSINSEFEGKAIKACYNFEHSLYAEHGNQSDYFNSYNNPFNPAESNIGAKIVLNIINNLEKEYPLIDNFDDTTEAVWFMLKKLPGFLTNKFRAKITAALKSAYSPKEPGDIGKTPAASEETAALIAAEKSNPDFMEYISSGKFAELVFNQESFDDTHIVQIFRFLLHSLTEKASLENTLENKQSLLFLLIKLEEYLRFNIDPRYIIAGYLLSLAVNEFNPLKIIREASSQKHVDFAKAALSSDSAKIEELNKKNKLISAFPENTSILIFGHYHTPAIHQWGERTYANPGSWKSVAFPKGRNSFRITQPLNYVSIEKDKNSENEIRLCNFKRTAAFRKLEL